MLEYCCNAGFCPDKVVISQHSVLCFRSKDCFRYERIRNRVIVGIRVGRFVEKEGGDFNPVGFAGVFVSHQKFKIHLRDFQLSLTEEVGCELLLEVTCRCRLERASFRLFTNSAVRIFKKPFAKELCRVIFCCK